MKYAQPIGEAADAPYIDADPSAGIEGSAVPAASIEHTQREIVNAIQAAGLTPDAADLTQLVAAIQTLIGNSTPNASTSARGLIEIATNAEAASLSDSNRALSPSGLGFVFSSQSLANNGYQMLPGGMIMQWGWAGGTGSLNAGESVDVNITFPIAFPTAKLLGIPIVNSNKIKPSFDGSLNTSAIIHCRNVSMGSGSGSVGFFVVGY